MKVPINWLKDYVDLPDDLNRFSRKMTEIGHMQDGAPKQVAGDTLYDFEIRQNRPDCLSLLGIARETAAVFQTKIKNPLDSLQEIRDKNDSTHVTIDDSSRCYRFSTVTIEGVSVTPSPEWLVKKLEAYGIKTINNIVDITNFVMVETGEPLHAYDAREIKNQEIIVRLAKQGEKITVLGGKEIELTANDLVIADTEKPLSVAGIIGGEHSGIHDDTTTIIIEDATYNQASIRRTSLRHSLRTEASTRHEKFLHTELSAVALRRAAQLIVELAGGKIVDHTDTCPVPTQNKKITLTLKNLERIGGVSISITEATTILQSLGFAIEQSTETTLTTTAPYFRTDIDQEEDVIEEVLRIYGYDKIPERLPHAPVPKDIQSKYFSLDEKIRDILIAAGYDEQITNPLTYESQPQKEAVVLENSLNADKTMLRTTLKNNLLNVVENQKKYRKQNVQLFELGKIYYKENNEYKEQRTLGLIASGKDITYLDVKGVIEELFERLGADYRQAGIEIAKLPGSENIYYSEINLETIEYKEYAVKPVYTFAQSLLQDISFYVAKDIAVGDIIDEIKKISPIIHKIELGEDRQVSDKRSILLHITFQSLEKNLKNEDIEPEKKRVIELVTNKYKGEVRM